jgi:hypothetical protein
MRLRITAAAVAAATVLCVAAARAEEVKPSSVHIAFTVGKAHVASVPSDVYDDAVLSLALGYTFDRSFAVEVFDQRFLAGPAGSAIAGIFGARPGPAEVPDKHQGVAAIGAFQLSDSWRVLGRVGVGRTRLAVYAPPGGERVRVENRTDPSVGLGLAVDASARWTWSLNATRFTKTKTSVATLGVQFRF